MNNKKRIHIDYVFRNEPYGGANQFLKNLKNYLIKMETYTEIPEEADIILLNHNVFSKRAQNAKETNPDITIVHRVDGPVSKHRKNAKVLDKHSFYLDKLICDATIFQSEWTKISCIELGYQGLLSGVIHNAPDPTKFIKKNQVRSAQNEKIKLVTTSWSANWNKGFDYMQYLDETLDYSKYEYTFVGRSPIAFNNIIVKEPMDTDTLSEELKKHDIYIALSKNESCSNSLIEAINCGLVVVARDSGCYRELVSEGGVIFKDKSQMISFIDKVANNLEYYFKKLPFYCIDDIGKAYYDFMVYSSENTRNKNKKWNFTKAFKWNLMCKYVKLYTKIWK